MSISSHIFSAIATDYISSLVGIHVYVDLADLPFPTAVNPETPTNWRSAKRKKSILKQSVAEALIQYACVRVAYEIAAYGMTVVLCMQYV